MHHTSLFTTFLTFAASDPVLALVPEHRRHTLLAQPTAVGEYSFNVVVQGENETVFFEI